MSTYNSKEILKVSESLMNFLLDWPFSCLFKSNLEHILCESNVKELFIFCPQCYSTPDGNKIGLTSCDISSKSGQVFTGQTNGVLVQLDRRMKKNIVASVQAHKKGIKSVHINPVHDHLLLTSSADL